VFRKVALFLAIIIPLIAFFVNRTKKADQEKVSNSKPAATKPAETKQECGLDSKDIQCHIEKLRKNIEQKSPDQASQTLKTIEQHFQKSPWLSIAKGDFHKSKGEMREAFFHYVEACDQGLDYGCQMQMEVRDH
jgi:hypothetical protein